MPPPQVYASFGSAIRTSLSRRKSGVVGMGSGECRMAGFGDNRRSDEDDGGKVQVLLDLCKNSPALSGAVFV